MSKEILDNIIQNFAPEKFRNFFREKNRNFSPREEGLSQYDTDIFSYCHKIGEINFENQNMLFVYIKTANDLTERSSKKKQYELAKKILKDLFYDTGIFIFYDSGANFRFSLVYTNYISKRRDWSNFRRFTYYVNKKLTNKTFLYRIGDLSFDSFENIKEAFSVDKVTKEFYKDIANWYFWAVDNSRFPKDTEEMENGRNIAIIRLITRLIFIWFMKEMKLIPEILFNRKELKNILRNTSDNESGYYKAVLQNLFFATLSTPANEREFASEGRNRKGYNSDFGNHNVFRYQEEFVNPENIKMYFNEIPFLNGGLFECLDNKNERFYIDGFSRTQKNQPNIPNKLFFEVEDYADLNIWYNTNNKNYKVKGILEILSSYNFTVDENSSDDADIALDPELLGKVFENLLASFNPETSTTARKATGSFYTPREIVDYMVNESLKEYFKTNLTDVQKFDEKLDILFDSTKTDNPFDYINTKKLVNLIENIKIVDPAVGSGAFPMGILNKLVFILNKIDSDNILWKEAQIKSIENIPDSRLREEMKIHIEKYFEEKNPDYGRKLYLIQKCIYGVDIQQIAVEIAKLRFFISLLIDEKIDKIKNNFGIEPLPNLDFKIMQGNSLLEEYEGIMLFDESLFEEIGFNRLNYLKVLQRKLNSIQKQYFQLYNAKTLSNEKDIELKTEINEIKQKIKTVSKKPGKTDKIFDIFDTYAETNLKRENLIKLHTRFYEAFKKEDKNKIKKEIEKLEYELIESTLILHKEKDKLAELEIIRKSNIKSFFIWKLQFPEVFQKGGFDIVIGNPPYIQLQKAGGKLANLYKNSRFQTFDRTGDIYALFYEKGINLLIRKGHLCYITSNKWMRSGYGEKLRDFFLRYNPKILIDLGPGIFENATVDTNILIVQKNNNKNSLLSATINERKNSSNFRDIILNNFTHTKYSNKDVWFISGSSENKLKEKIEIKGSQIKNWGVNIYRGIITGLTKAFIIDTEIRNILINEESKADQIIKPYLRGRDLNNYKFNWKGLYILLTGYDVNLPKDYPSVYNYLKQYYEIARRRDDQGKYWWNLRSCTYYSEFEKEKVVWSDISIKPTFVLLPKGYYFNNTIYMISNNDFNLYLCGVLNSKLISWYFPKIASGLGGGGNRYFKQFVEKIPIPLPTAENLFYIKQIEEIVNKINNENSITELDIKGYKFEIDKLIYKLFDFTDSEIKILEK